MHRSKPFLGGLCFITDRKISRLESNEMVAIAVKAGAKWIQYREKEKTRREIYMEATGLRDITKESGAIFIVNDHVDIALSSGADGVHLGQDDLPLREARSIMGRRIIGVSAHSVAEAIDAERAGADYIGFGPVFHTATKDAGEPKGIEMVREVRRHVRIPIVAIGGIRLEDVPGVRAAGADAVAVASAILKGDVYENVKSFVSTVALDPGDETMR